MGFVYFLITGIVGGWVAGMMYYGKNPGFLRSIFIGCTGYFVGSRLFAFLNISSSISMVYALGAAIIGSFLLFVLFAMFKKMVVA